jgi:superfamily II DNA/RNA helicase
MDQRSRMATLDQFRKGELTLLIASDVAARGLDIPDVSHVFNYDLPTHSEDYVHRIGRTGRAGRSGVAISIVTGSDQKYLTSIEKLIERPLPWYGEPIDFDSAASEQKARRKSGGRAQRDGDTDDEAKPRRRSRTGGRDRKSEQAQTAQADEKPTAEASEPASQDSKSEPKPSQGKAPARRGRAAKPAAQEEKRQSSKRRRGNGGKDDEPVIGLGDHVPAFLLRDTRPKKAS